MLGRSASRLQTAAALCRLVPLFWTLGVLKHVVPLRWLARWAWRTHRPSSRPAARATIVGRVLRAGAIAGAPDRDCLQRSLLLYRELSHHGFAPVLVIGFRRAGTGAPGHAWVTLGGEVIAESSAGLWQFEPVLRFGVHGSRDA
jgi:hypothetical protein